jgi:hypothetical protein
MNQNSVGLGWNSVGFSGNSVGVGCWILDVGCWYAQVSKLISHKGMAELAHAIAHLSAMTTKLLDESLFGNYSSPLAVISASICKGMWECRYPLVSKLISHKGMAELAHACTHPVRHDNEIIR